MTTLNFLGLLYLFAPLSSRYLHIQDYESLLDSLPIVSMLNKKGFFSFLWLLIWLPCSLMPPGGK